MKIVAIMGSPHAGNTLEQLEMIGEKLGVHDDVDFGIINLKELDLKACTGCFVCFIKGDSSCPLKDDRQMLLEKLDAADGVIFATPVYSMHVSYLMKAFIDRFACTFHRPRFFCKYAMGVVVTGNMGAKETLSYLKMTAKVWGFDYVGGLAYAMAPRNTSMKVSAFKKDRTDAVVEEFYQAIRSQRPQRLSFSDLMMFQMMRAVYQKLETMSPYDYQYWKEKGWFEPKTKYFCENVKINPLKQAVVRFVTWIIKRQMEKAFKD